MNLAQQKQLLKQLRKNKFGIKFQKKGVKVERLFTVFGNLVVLHPEKSVIDVYNAFMQSLEKTEDIQFVSDNFALFLEMGDSCRDTNQDYMSKIYQIENS